MNKKVKAINPQIVVHGTIEKPYYEISYYNTSDNQWHIGYGSYDLQTVKEYLDNCFEIIETDVEPVKHGKWISMLVKRPDWKGNTQSYYQPNTCSECHVGLAEKTNYCPNCGAKMDGESND